MKSFLTAVMAVLMAASIAGALTYNRSSAQTMANDGVIWAADGSALAPSISFYSDTDSGFYLTSAGVVGVTINGVDAGAVASTIGQRGPVPATQVIGAGGTITADACGGIKNISSAAAVTTDTTNTFTAPAAANKGCIMVVCNVNAADAITLDDNALSNLAGIAGATPGDTVLGALDCVQVGSTGTVWSQHGAGAQN